MLAKEVLNSDADNKALKAKLRLISDLKVPGSILLDNANLAEYVYTALPNFVDNFPRCEEQIKAALNTSDYNALSKILTDLCYRLKTIHAGDLANDCQKQMAKLPDIRQKKVEAYMTFFLTTLSMLSIDIQMVVHSKQDAEPAVVRKDADGAASESRNILAVDDEPFFLLTLETALQNTQYKLTGVTSGFSALRFLQNHNPDLFILDIEMPDMDGYELAQRIKDTKQTAPILFLTGNAKTEYVTRAIKMGASDFILKPINKDLVLTRIGRFI